MAMLEAKMGMSDSSSSSHVFETGNYQVKNITLKKSHTTKPPVDLFIVAPLQEGKYSLLLFCHGFHLSNTWYTTLLQHIASHGYIVIAPQFYGIIAISIPEEVDIAAEENVTGDADNLALSGHSRGGKTAFALALGRKVGRDNKFKALIGIDPVAGAAPSSRPLPEILEYIPRCFNMSIPVAVIGTEYGNQSNGLVLPFAPDGVNHSGFYNESKPPACYFLTRACGHDG
ncbi:hypothetical protein ACS0TY_012257 [Phlomoides rotata]